MAKRGDVFEKRFKELTEFYHKFGHSYVKTRDDEILSRWCNAIRQQYKNNHLPKEKIDRLMTLDFSWSSWEHNYKKMVRFADEYGEFKIPLDYPDKELISWRYKQMFKKEHLSEERLNFLNAIGFFSESKLDKKWSCMFEKLKEYKQMHGHCFISYSFRDKQLVKWVESQLSQYRQGSLIKEKVDKLNSIDFIWDRNEAKWEQMFLKLKNFKTIYGHTKVNAEYDAKLKYWVLDQRKAYFGNGSCRLSPSRIKKLESIGFDWNVYKVKQK